MSDAKMSSQSLLPQVSSHKAYVPLPPLPSIKRTGSSCRKAKMEPDYHYPRTDEEILRYLSWYVVGEPPPCRFIGETNLLLFQGEQPPDVRMPGSSGRWYYYTDCFYKQVSGRPTRERRTVDGMGFWKSTNGQRTIDENGLTLGYRQDFRFRRLEAGREAVSTTWVMTEYTLHANSSDDNRKAVCVLRNTREG